MKNNVFSILILSLALLLFGCEEPANKGNGIVYDQTEMLENYANNVILPSIENFNTAATALNNDTDKFLADPSVTNLSTLRSTFLNTYLSFEKTNVFAFMDAANIEGTNKTYATRINGFPVCESTSPYELAGGVPCDQAKNQEDLGVDQQILKGNLDPSKNSTISIGLPAIEYLIFGLENLDDQNLVSKYTDNDTNKNRRAYLKNLCNYLESLSKAQLDAWNNNYKSKFLENKGNDSGSSLSKFVNSQVQDFEAVLRHSKIRQPIQTKSRFVESYYAKKGALLAKAHLQAHIDFFMGVGPNGTNGKGLYDNLITIKAGETSNGNLLADDILAQFNKTKTALDEVKDPLAEAVDSNDAALLATYNEMQLLIPLLKGEMTSALGVTIIYADNDGD